MVAPSSPGQVMSKRPPRSSRSANSDLLKTAVGAGTHPQHRLNRDAVCSLSMNKGEALGCQEVAAFSLIRVTSGLLKVAAVRPNAETRTIGFFFPGEIVAVDSWQSTADIEIEALLPTQIEIFFLERMTDRDEVLTKRLLEELREQLAKEQRSQLIYAFGRIEERLAALLLKLLEINGSGEAGRTVVNLPMRRTDMADYLGIRIETLSRHLTSWAAKGLIALPSPRKAVLLDVAGLESLVSHSPCARR